MLSTRFRKKNPITKRKINVGKTSYEKTSIDCVCHVCIVIKKAIKNLAKFNSARYDNLYSLFSQQLIEIFVNVLLFEFIFKTTLKDFII